MCMSVCAQLFQAAPLHYKYTNCIGERDSVVLFDATTHPIAALSIAVLRSAPSLATIHIYLFDCTVFVFFLLCSFHLLFLL